MENIKNVIVISDTHCGCAFGLYNGGFVRDEGIEVKPSKLQKKVWKMWETFWNEWVPRVTKEEPYVVVHNGDIIDGEHHKTTTHITGNTTDQMEIAYRIMRPVVEKAHKYFQIRGTEVHTGEAGRNEEELAKRLGAEPDELGNHSRYELWLRMSNYLIHFSHHIGATGSSAYESTAVYKEMVEAFNEAGRWGDDPPDVVVRSHRHRQFETRIATEWQLKVPYVHRLPSGRASTPQVGGYLIRHGPEDQIFTRFKVWKIKRPREVIV
jgi:hypothetical protein